MTMGPACRCVHSPWPLPLHGTGARRTRTSAAAPIWAVAGVSSLVRPCLGSLATRCGLGSPEVRELPDKDQLVVFGHQAGGSQFSALQACQERIVYAADDLEVVPATSSVEHLAIRVGAAVGAQHQCSPQALASAPCGAARPVLWTKPRCADLVGGGFSSRLASSRQRRAG